MHYPAPSRPAVFRRPRLLIVGCGDVGLRLSRLVRHFRMRALTSDAARRATLREAGIVPLVGDLDRADTLGRLAGLASRVAHLAPPPGEGDTDPRTARLVHALARRPARLRLVYASTTGVYGDARGALCTEARAPAPRTARARRRLDAEQRLRTGARIHGWSLSVLRVPGIYAWDRPGGDPRERLRRGTPVLHADEDIYTNHVHADDLARAAWAALFRARPLRTYNACDDVSMKTGDYYDRLADLCGLPRPPRIGWDEARRVLSATQLSFWSESRRLSNARARGELRWRLRYPDVSAAWRAAR